MATPVPSPSGSSAAAVDTTLGEKTVRFLSRKLRAMQYRRLDLTDERRAIDDEIGYTRADIQQLERRIQREFVRNPRLFRGYTRPPRS